MQFQYAAGSPGDRRELTPYGKLRTLWRLAMARGSAADVAMARQALDEFHTRHGTHGKVLQLYHVPGQPTARRVPVPASRPAARTGSGGSVLAELNALRASVRDMLAATATLRADAARKRQQRDRARGWWIEHNDPDDPDEFELVLTEEEQRKRMHRLIG